MAQLTVDELVELLADLQELGVSEFTWGDLTVKMRPLVQPPAVAEPPEAKAPWVRDAEARDAQLNRSSVRMLAAAQGIGPLSFPKADNA